MSGKPGNIFSGHHGEVSQELLLRYVGGKATPEECRLVEEQMADDPFLADAVEGLMAARDPEKVKRHLDEIKTEIQVQAQEQQRRVFPIKRVLLVAASLALLITSGWLINSMMTRSTQKIFTNEFQPYPAPTKGQAPDVITENSDTSIQKALPQTGITTGQQKPEKKQTGNEKHYNATDKNEASRNEAAPALKQVENTDEKFEAPPQEYKANEEVVAQNDNSVRKSQADSIQSSEAVPSSTQSLVQTGATSQPKQDAGEMPQAVAEEKEHYLEKDVQAHKDLLNHGLELYHEGNYAGAISQFGMLLKDEPDNPAANFYSAVSYLALDNADEALKKLKKLDNNKNGQYYEATLWYESLAYVKKGDKKSAINVLEKIIKLNGEYNAKAQELLQQLK